MFALFDQKDHLKAKYTPKKV